MVKLFLKKSLKELNELKDKVTESEIPIPIIVTESKVNDEMINFYKNENKELKEKLEKAERERDDYKSKLEVKDREAWELKHKKKDFGQSVAKEVERYGVTAVKTGVEEGSKIFPVIGSAVGGLLGAGYGGIGALTHVGAHAAEQGKEVYEETLNVGADLAEKVGGGVTGLIKEGMSKASELGEDVKEFAQDAMHVGADLHKTNIHAITEGIEGFRKGGENLAGKVMDNTKEVITKNLELAEKAVEGGIGAKYGNIEIGIGMGKAEEKVLKERVENKDEIIKSQKETIEKLKKENESLLKRIEKQTDKTQDDFLNVIGMITKSQQNSPSHSRASTPPPYVKEPQ